MSFTYPTPRRDDSIFDDYHGSKIQDPYRWMEDPDAEETKAFVNAENAVTDKFLESFPNREKLFETIKNMWDYPRYSCPSKRGSRYFYSYNTGLQNQSVMYVQTSLTAEASVFLDPNLLSEDGTTALSGSSFSEDGSLFAYGLSKAGSDWITIQFKDVETNKDLPDVLHNAKFSCMSWTHDNAGIFYNQYPTSDGKSDGTETTANLNQKLYYHRLGTPQSEDILCAEWPDNPKWMGHLAVSHCGSYGVVSINDSCDPVNRLFYCNLKTLPNGINGLLPVVKVVDNFDAEYEYITNEGSLFTFKTNLNSPRYKLIQIDFDNFEQSNWKTLVEEHEHDVLEWASCVNDNKLVLCYLHDCKNVLYIHDLATGQRLAELPLDIGTVNGYSGKKKNTEIFYQFASFLTPGVIYHCDMTKVPYTPTVFRETVVKGFQASDFVTSQKFYSSTDGTKIPMFIVHKKDIVLDGSHPVLLYGYGGFNISITPSFSVSRLVFMNHLGGVFAVPNLRGGGEYGETWHRGGMLANKQNVFDDFQTAAKFLVAENYTQHSRIIIQGGSNGGLLVGACVNQRPELFGCAIAQVGVMDMLRFHKFTIGYAWTSDYGCADKPEEFNWLIKYSPLHNVRPHPDPNVQYPALLLLTADHDDRVVPLHSLKYIAEVQHKIGASTAQTNPLMIRVDTKAGHGFGKSTTKTIEELRDIYSFIALVLNLKWRD